MKLSVLWLCSPLQLWHRGAGLSREHRSLCRGAVSWDQPLGLQQRPCSCRAHHRGHNTHISPGPLLLLDATRAGRASHRRCGKEIIKENQTHFEVSRWEQAEPSACFYGAPCEASVPSGCQHRPFPEGDFFPSLCREAAAPSSSPSPLHTRVPHAEQRCRALP